MRDINRSHNQDQQTDSHRNKYGLLPTVKQLDQATTVLLKMVQGEVFADEIKVLGSIPDHQVADRVWIRGKKNALKKSSLYHVDPFIDEDGILRVGGRLRHESLDFVEKHPAVLPKDHQLSELLIQHHHGAVHHQGRQITHRAVRQAGYWIISGHSAVTKVLDACVTCKKARGAMMTQHMADLPKDQTEPTPPLTNVGLDAFGPRLVRTRKLQGGTANNKRWGLLFTCLSSRAIK